MTRFPPFLRPSRYADPAGDYVAVFAQPWRRAAAAAVDWTLCGICILVLSIPLGLVQGVGALSWRDAYFSGLPGHVVFIAAQALTGAPAVAYFAVLLPTSQTLGMRLLGIRTVVTRTGRAPSYVRATLRGIVATAVAAAVYFSYLVATSFDKPRHLDATSKHALLAVHVVAAFGGVSALVMMLTTSRRSIVDRIFGTAGLDELEAVHPRMGPWGSIDAFDLSWRRGAEREPAPSAPTAAS